MSARILVGDCRAMLATLDAESAQCVVTSPPYFGLRAYLPDGHTDKAREIGAEPTPAEYVAGLVDVFREVRRVLRDDGTVFLNLGDSYAGSWGAQSRPTDDDRSPVSTTQIVAARKQTRTGSIPRDADYKAKDLLGIPWAVAFALRADGWYLRSEIIWAKPNPMPESVTDRPTKAHETVFLLSKSPRYVYDADAIAEPQAESTVRIHSRANVEVRAGAWKTEQNTDRRDGNSRSLANGAARDLARRRNARSVWTIATQPYRGAHFATMPPALAERCIKAGSRPGDTVLDPFAGAGTTLLVADRLGRDGVGCELNPAYAALAEQRIRGDAPLFAEPAA